MPDPRPIGKPKPEEPQPCESTSLKLEESSATIADRTSTINGLAERLNNADRNALKQQELEAGVGTYTANLLPVRENLINWVQTVALDGVTKVLVTMVKE